MKPFFVNWYHIGIGLSSVYCIGIVIGPKRRLFFNYFGYLHKPTVSALHLASCLALSTEANINVLENIFLNRIQIQKLRLTCLDQIIVPL